MAEKKCMNRVVYKKPKLKHSANDQCCVVLQFETERILNIIDHGY